MWTRDADQGAPLLEGAEHGSLSSDRLPSVEQDQDRYSQDGGKGMLTRRRVIVMAITLVVFLMVPIALLTVIPAEVEAECRETEIHLVEVSPIRHI